MIAPTEYGLLKNGITGSVDLEKVYDGGRHFIGWGHEFVLFPSHLITVSFGNISTDTRYPIQARTGPGEDEDSGGQPLSLSISFQYKLQRGRVADVYRTFGKEWETSYMRFAQQAVTDTAQQFTPRNFWTIRQTVEKAMADAVNATLIRDGFAQIEHLQLTSIAFQASYEQMITNIQLQEQLRVTKGFQLLTTQVLKSIDLLQSETDAQVTRINAEGARVSAILINEASANALQQEQAAKAIMYKRLRDHLNFTQPQFLEYIKMKSLNSQPSTKVKLGVNPVGGISI